MSEKSKKKVVVKKKKKPTKDDIKTKKIELSKDEEDGFYIDG